ncbi:MAG: DNRLRE domain-containing protein, partial [Chloroflexota bacterium]|nr:DNRLRE domain-containing protein [Chloroflexota bacterium]
MSASRHSFFSRLLRSVALIGLLLALVGPLASAQDGEPTATPPPVETPTSIPEPTETAIPIDTDTPVPPDTETPVPVDTDTPVPPDTETPAAVDTETPAPSETPVLATETGQPTETETDTADFQSADDPVTTTFGANADTWLDGSSAGTGSNYGSATSVRTDGNPLAHGLIRFSVSGVSGSVQSATLRLYVRDATNNGPRVALSDPNWSESTVTWNSRPAQVGNPTGDTGALSVGSWAEFDVTALVAGSGQISFLLLPDSADTVQFTSRNSTATSQRPQLVITFDQDGPSATPSHTPAPSSTNTAVPTATVGPQAFTFGAIADTRITDVGTGADTNYGNETSFYVDNTPELNHSLIKFTVSGGSGSVTSAVLRLYVRDGSNNGPKIYQTSNDWSETGVTWNTRPAMGSVLLADLGALSTGQTIDIDVTAAVGGNGTVSFYLVPDSTDAAKFTSRNSTATTQRPALLVTFDPLATPPTVTNTTEPPTVTHTPTETLTPTETPTATETGTPT